MRGLYHVLKKYERDFLDLRKKFYLGEDIGFGSLPIHHHWEADSMPLAAIPVRSRGNGLEVKTTVHHFLDWHDYNFVEELAIGGLKGTTIVKPLPSNGEGYLISAYMYKAFLDTQTSKIPSDVWMRYHKQMKRDALASGEVYPLHPAFTEMPRQVFRGGLSIMLGSLVSQTETPNELSGAFGIIPHAEWDESLTFSIYVGEAQNVKHFLDYWELVFEKYILKTGKPEINPEMERLMNKVRNRIESSCGLTLRKLSSEKNELQFNILKSIKLRKLFLEEHGF